MMIAVGGETQKLKVAYNKIPLEKRNKKWKSTLIGLGSIALALICKGLGWFPDWLLIGLLIFGGYSLAGDLVRGFAAWFPAAIKDIKTALKS